MDMKNWNVKVIENEISYNRWSKEHPNVIKQVLVNDTINLGLKDRYDVYFVKSFTSNTDGIEIKNIKVWLINWVRMVQYFKKLDDKFGNDDNRKQEEIEYWIYSQCPLFEVEFTKKS